MRVDKLVRLPSSSARPLTPPHRGSEANQRDHPGAGAVGAHHWHAPTSKSMSDDHRTGRLCADAARLARRHFVRKSMRPRLSSRGLSIPARARRVNLFGSSTYGREESCRMQVLCSSASQPSKKQARLAVHASPLVRARLRLNEHSCPRERQTCTTFAEPPDVPKRAVRKKVPSRNALLLLRYFTSVHTTGATMAPHRLAQVRVFPPPSIRRAAWPATNAHRARALHAHVLGHPPRATY